MTMRLRQAKLFHYRFRNACACIMYIYACIISRLVSLVLFLCIYVCMCVYVCMHVCMYVCMRVCRYVCIYVLCTYVSMYVCMHTCMYECMSSYVLVCLLGGWLPFLKLRLYKYSHTNINKSFTHVFACIP